MWSAKVITPFVRISAGGHLPPQSGMSSYPALAPCVDNPPLFGHLPSCVLSIDCIQFHALQYVILRGGAIYDNHTIGRQQEVCIGGL